MLLKRYKDIEITLSIILFWIILIILINPYTDGCIGDDWAYAKPVLNLIHGEGLHITDWSSMTLVFHVLWGALFSEIFGFSFTVLRLSVLLLGLCGFIGTFYFLKEINPNRIFAVLGTSLIALNPVYLQHSFTFMTDISYYGFMIWAAYFFLKYLKNEKLQFIISALIFCFISFLIREVALVLPFGFAVGYIYKKGFSFKSVFIAVIPLIIIGLEYLGYRYWYENIHGITANMDYCRNKMASALLGNKFRLLFDISKNFLVAIVFFGLYFFPLVILLLKKILPELNRIHVLVSIIITLTTLSMFLYLMYIQNNYLLIMRGHLFAGIVTTGDVTSINSINAKNNFAISNLMIYILFIFSYLSGFFTLCVSVFHIKKFRTFKNIFSKNSGVMPFIISTFFAYMLPISTQNMFTRYLIPIFPLVIGILLNQIKDEQFAVLIKKLSAALAAIIVLISILVQVDFMQYNRQRYAAISFLTNDLQISPVEIDGTLEFNAWYFYDSKYNVLENKKWCWIIDDKYMINSNLVLGYDVIKEYSYKRCLPPCAEEYLYVLKRVDWLNH